MAELAARLPIRTFIDHGPNVQPAAATDDFLQKVYPQLYAKGQHRVAKPGDKIQMAGLNVVVVSSAGDVIKTPLSGGGAPNPSCANFKPGDGNAEDPMSVGTYVTYGRFRTVHLGDLTKQKEFELLCPNNRIGTVDVFLGLHHGVDSSNSEVIHGLRPRVAIMNNGTRKGARLRYELCFRHRASGFSRCIFSVKAEHRAGYVHRRLLDEPSSSCRSRRSPLRRQGL
jgi:hypothetical protein